MLEALPYPGPDREAIVAAHLAIWAVFAPRARALTARIGGTWPDAFEAAMKARLKAELGVAPA